MITQSKIALNELRLFVRETIFEEVREKHFASLPSRKTCIWVSEENAVSYWWKTLSSNGQNNYKILKLNLSGSIHRADQQYLSWGTFSLNQLRYNAFKYWAGSDGSNPIEEELLFEGNIEVIDEVMRPYQNRSQLDKLRDIRSQFATPEDINDGVETAPSKRLLNLYNFYNKDVFGSRIAKRIGIDNIRNECKHFNEWLVTLIGLALYR